MIFFLSKKIKIDFNDFSARAHHSTILYFDNFLFEDYKKITTKTEVFLICLVLRPPWRVVFGSELAKTGYEWSKTVQIKNTIAFWLRMS